GVRGVSGGCRCVLASAYVDQAALLVDRRCRPDGCAGGAPQLRADTTDAGGTCVFHRVIDPGAGAVGHVQRHHGAVAGAAFVVGCRAHVQFPGGNRHIDAIAVQHRHRGDVGYAGDLHADVPQHLGGDRVDQQHVGGIVGQYQYGCAVVEFVVADGGAQRYVMLVDPLHAGFARADVEGEQLARVDDGVVHRVADDGGLRAHVGSGRESHG